MIPDPRRFLLDFRHREYGVDEHDRLAPQFAGMARNLRNAIEQLSEGLYSSDVHFLLELIQNAEDNTYPPETAPRLRLVLLQDDPTTTPGSQGCLCIFNNERGFQPEHVESLCRIGASTKKNRAGYIGEKGIGFKSVFVASHTPHLYSNGFQFKFREDDPDLGLAYVIPYWVEHVPEVVRASDETTAILLPLKPGRYQQIESELTRIAPETLLFLSKLERIEIHIPAAGIHRILARRRNEDGTLHLRVAEHGEWRLAARYWVKKRRQPVPPGLDEPKREGIDGAEISIALPLDGQPSRGTVYAYLPTGVESGLPFLVNADFLLPANRETLHLDRPWNLWLRDAAGELAAEAIAELIQEPRFRHQAYGFIPLDDHLRDLKRFFEPLARDVRHRLGERPLILDEQERLVPPAQAWLADATLRRLTRPAPRPIWFQQHTLVHETLQNHERRLRAIGVRDLRRNAAELLACLGDPHWLTELDLDRLAELLAYLRERHFVRNELAELPLLPLADGRRVALKDAGPIHLAAAEDERQRLQALQQHRLPAVQCLDDGLRQRLQDRAELWAWFRDTFAIRPFSLADHLTRRLLPWIKEQRQQLTSDGALAVLKLLDHCWERLDNDQRKALSALPLPLEDGRLAAAAELPPGGLATPRALDPEDGWQHLLTPPAVLADACLEAIPDRERLRTLLTGLGASDAPAPPQVRLGEEDLDDPRLGPYLRHILQGRTPGRALSVETPFPPEALFRDPEDPHRRARALIRWLDKRLQADPLGSQDRATLRLGHANERPQSVESALQWLLRRTPWLPVEGTLQPPATCFQELDPRQHELQSALPVVTPPLPSAVARYLGVKDRLSDQDLLSHLRELAAGEHRPDPARLARLYRHLGDHGETALAALREEPLIHLPDSGRWLRATETVWEDAGDLLGPGPWLAPHYPPDLKDLFLAAGSAERPSLAAHIQAWLDLPRRSLPPDALRQALARLYPRLAQAARRDELRPEEIQRLRQQARLLDRNGRLRPAGELHLDDDPDLARLFPEAHGDLVWLPEDQPPATLRPLLELFPVPRLSQRVEIRLLGPVSDQDPTPPPRLFPRPARRLLAWMLHSEYPELYRAAEEDGRLANLLGARLLTLPRLELEAHWPIHGSRPLPRRHIHWDSAGGRLLIERHATMEDLRDELAEQLARHLAPGSHSSQLADTLHRILECHDDDRARRLAEKRGWRPAADAPHAQTIESWLPPQGSDLGSAPPPREMGTAKANPPPKPPHPGTAPESPAPGGITTTRRAQTADKQREHFRLLPLDEDGEAPASTENDRDPRIFVLDFPDRPLGRATTQPAPLPPRRQRHYSAIPTLLHPVGNGNNGPRCRIEPGAESTGPGYEDKAALTFAAAWFEVRGYRVALENKDTLQVEKHQHTHRVLVKGLRESWPEHGLPLSREQHDRLRSRALWLLVVEYLTQPSRTQAHLITKPAEHLNHYHLDRDWRLLAEEAPDESP